ncbi:MAG TPA: choice-of-anchor R domain-containing protein [Candidatus Limnocylindrales bacterium]|nr:choice-of-anchor R domain-containing protein [Candidatus Limnocylindrales bacterium]
MRSVFFYPIELAQNALAMLVARAEGVQADDPNALITFADEAGGTASHAFAVTYLGGMDDIEVTDATLAFRARTLPTQVHGFSSAPYGGGVKLTLTKPARLRSVSLACPSPVPALGGGAQLIVQPMDGATPAPPLYAQPPITLGGGLYTSSTRSISVTVRTDGYDVTFNDPPSGTGWLFTLLRSSVDLTKAAPDPSSTSPALTSVKAVTIDAVPTDLAVTLTTSSGAVQVWNHPGPLFPENGVQSIGFAPIARKELKERLKTAAGPTLPLTLSFTSTTAGALTLIPAGAAEGGAHSALDASYTAKPLASDPLTVRLEGSWVPLEVNAPARRPDATVRGVARVKAVHPDKTKAEHLEVNAMTPVADADFAGMGVVVDASLRIAVSSRIEPLLASRTIALAEVRLPLQTTAASEAVVEIHADAAGLPGTLAGKPVVVQLPANARATTAFTLKPPLPVISGGAPLWVVVRCTTGSVFWHAARGARAGDGTARASADGGKTWRPLRDGPASDAAVPFAQLVQRAPDTEALPPVRVRVRATNGAAPVAAELEIGTQGAITFPPAVLDALAHAGGTGKATTTLELASDAVVDLTFSGLELVYTP